MTLPLCDKKEITKTLSYSTIRRHRTFFQYEAFPHPYKTRNQQGNSIYIRTQVIFMYISVFKIKSSNNNKCMVEFQSSWCWNNHQTEPDDHLIMSSMLSCSFCSLTYLGSTQQMYVYEMKASLFICLSVYWVHFFFHFLLLSILETEKMKMMHEAGLHIWWPKHTVVAWAKERERSWATKIAAHVPFKIHIYLPTMYFVYLLCCCFLIDTEDLLNLVLHIPVLLSIKSQTLCITLLTFCLTTYGDKWKMATKVNL